MRDLGAALKIEGGSLSLRALRMTPAGMRAAVLEAPTNVLPRITEGLRFRAVLTTLYIYPPPLKVYPRYAAT